MPSESVNETGQERRLSTVHYQRTVAVDETGLQGVYDIKAEWRIQPDQATVAAVADNPRDALQFAMSAAM